jgi:hypothetical protein
VQAKWTDQILDEVFINLARDRPDLLLPAMLYAHEPAVFGGYGSAGWADC